MTGTRGKQGLVCERGGRAYRTKLSSEDNLCTEVTVFKFFYFTNYLP